MEPSRGARHGPSEEPRGGSSGGGGERWSTAMSTPLPAGPSGGGSGSTSGKTAAMLGTPVVDPLTPESRNEMLKLMAQAAAAGGAQDKAPGGALATRGSSYALSSASGAPFSLPTPTSSVSSSSAMAATKTTEDVGFLSPHKMLLKNMESVLPSGKGFDLGASRAAAGGSGIVSTSSSVSSSLQSLREFGLGPASGASSAAAALSTATSAGLYKYVPSGGGGPSPMAVSSSSGAVSTFASRSLPPYAAPPSAPAPSSENSISASMLSVDGHIKERSRCTAEITYNSLVRVRYNNHQCLRISTAAPPETPRVSSITTTSHRATARNLSSSSVGQFHAAGVTTVDPSQAFIDVHGNGLGYDPDQILVMVNASRRADRGNVQFTHDIALYCVEGSCKGRFLSFDPSTQQLRTKKGPVIGNSEKWRIVNPKLPSDKRTDVQLFSESFGSLQGVSKLLSATATTQERERDRVILTSDKVMLKVWNMDLYLSVRRDPYDSTVSVILAPEEEETHTLTQHWEITKSNIPYDPSWNREREYLTGEALVRSNRRSETDSGDLNLAPLSSFPPSLQESIIVDDLLFAFIGVEGRYVKLEVTETSVGDGKLHRSFKFVLDQYGMDPSVSTLASRCFPMGECYLKLTLFVEQYSRYEYGQVSHAFCAALKSLIKEYTIVIVQLEHQLRATDESLSIQKLWYLIQPSYRTMEILSKLTDACRSSSGGGSLLNEMQRLKSSLAGDVKARQLFSFLMERASVPYLKMVETWIYYGELVDPYDEFMVRCDGDISHEDLTQNPYSTYWEDRFTLRQAQVPMFLSRGASKILSAGKYLNIFRTCNRDVRCPFATPIDYIDSESAYDELIDRAYGYASRTLLQFFVVESDLASRLASLKHYFLMDQGDFFIDFMDAAESEMKIDTGKIAISRLESLLHMSLQTSTCSGDPYRDDLMCFLSPVGLLNQLTAIHERAQKGTRDSLSVTASIGQKQTIGYKVVEAFNLDFKVQWPMTLVISCGELTKYQMLFRHLFFCKHVEKTLCDAWLNHQSVKEFSVRAELGRSFCLRQRMLHFQQNLLYYMMVEVISPRWHAFQRQLATVETLDDVLEHHRAFLDICLKECLLSDPDLLKMIYKIMRICGILVDQIDMLTKPYFLDEETIKQDREDKRDRRAEKRAREEADAALLNFDRGARGAKKAPVLKRRESSQIDARRQRIKALADDFKQSVAPAPENEFRKRTSDLENTFDSAFRDFMSQLIRRSRIQRDAHLSNLCTRLDYNGYYTSQQ